MNLFRLVSFFRKRRESDEPGCEMHEFMVNLSNKTGWLVEDPPNTWRIKPEYRQILKDIFAEMDRKEQEKQQP